MDLPMKFVTNQTDTFNYSVERVCKNCSNSFSGRYCNRCGERVSEAADKSVVSILSDVLQGFTFLDNKAIRTVKLMFARTGELTRNFMEGVRVPFMKPLSVFFIANLVYFLFPAFDTFNSPLRTQMHFLPHSAIARNVVENRLVKEQVSLAEFTIRYEQQSTNMAKLLLIVFVFFVALILALINYSSRNYFYDHLLAALEFCSLLIMVALLFIPWTLKLVASLWPGSSDWVALIFQDSVFSLIVSAICFSVFFMMEKRVYQQKTINAIIKATLMLPGLFIAVQCYRVVLFFVTMWTL